MKENADSCQSLLSFGRQGEQHSDTSSSSTAPVSRNVTDKETESSLFLAVFDTDSHEAQAASRGYTSTVTSGYIHPALSLTEMALASAPTEDMDEFGDEMEDSEDSSDDEDNDDVVENSDRNGMRNAYSNPKKNRDLKDDVLDKYFEQLQARIVAQKYTEGYERRTFWVLSPDPFFALIKKLKPQAL
ncbi:hypothetical protein BDB00DRAFT_245258 [Zychaea mexicana]|uniref:uncharacterized protein n=1 Tax=Zychaea mexicana TaxID=64656 RepID=UPI0022FE2502|nr:uncharacterized protein BDB00DRAFT_245258 [Zychaea mexicana]KAI9495361.1 hypothetical protein BDB00DRAFT_245258 [Zychaea mexicana]